MSKIILKKLSDPVYKRAIYLIVGDQEKCLKAVEKKLSIPEGYLVVEHDRIGAVWNMNNGKLIIWLHRYSNRPEDVDTMIHEVFHLTHGVMDYVGMKLTSDSEEAYAYYAGFITRQIVEACKKK